MKSLPVPLLTLLLVAAAVWGLALTDTLRPGAGSASEMDVPAGQEYADADSLVARRVLGQADGLHAASPDGQKIAFVTWPGGNVAVRDLTTDQVTELTSDGNVTGDEDQRFGYSTYFSPDGGSVAYQWTDGFELWEIRVVDVETGEIRTILPDRENVRYAQISAGSWSPDGRWLAAVVYMEDGSRRLTLLPLDGGEAVTLRSFDWEAPTDVAFSSDGEWIVYDIPVDESGRRPGTRIEAVAVDGSASRTLVDNGAETRVVGWMPSGGPFFYLTGEGGRFDLMAVEVEDGRTLGAPARLRGDLWHVWPRGLTDDQFFYVQMPERRMAHVAAFDAEAGRLTGPLTPLDPNRSMSWPVQMAWAPDGERVAYLVDEAPSQLVIRSLATGSERTFDTPFSVHNSHFTWSPTDEVLALAGIDDLTRAGIHLVDLSEGTHEPLVLGEFDGVNFRSPQWTPDGGALYMTRGDARRTGVDIVRYELDSGEFTEVFISDRWLAYGLSPDATELAVLVYEMDGSSLELLRVPAAGGDAVLLASLPITDRPERSAGVTWTPDGEHIVFGPPWAEGRERTLQIVRRDGGTVRELARFVSAGGGGIAPRIHPDGDRISFIAGENRWEVWALEGLDAERIALALGDATNP